ncbi:MAG: hypothetical protein PHO48_03645 [Candidatus Gracilibacteria bacterium]|nr:hypothetical protein [Candidatus Gracilibacteria bacterium]MDD5179462.1 hypothetical protein [Candidatus Gracilibacteria bacterium]
MHSLSQKFANHPTTKLSFDPMRERLQHGIKKLSRGNQLALLGSILGVFTTLMPWHTIGVAALNTQHSYNGFQDQNFIVGAITFAFMLAAFLLVGLPLIGIQPPRMAWKKSSTLLFLGGESALLVLVLTFMHATSEVRSASYDLRLGIHLALFAAALVFFGGYMLRMDESANSFGRADPLTRAPRSPHHLDLSHKEVTPEDKEKMREDSRVRLDI